MIPAHCPMALITETIQSLLNIGDRRIIKLVHELICLSRRTPVTSGADHPTDCSISQSPDPITGPTRSKTSRAYEVQEYTAEKGQQGKDRASAFTACWAASCSSTASRLHAGCPE